MTTRPTQSSAIELERPPSTRSEPACEARSCSPAGNRDATSIFSIAASWEKAEDDPANIEWARATWWNLHRFSTGGAYVNFLTEAESEKRIHAAYGKNDDRPVEIKIRWNPENLFRTNKNIAPQGG